MSCFNFQKSKMIWEINSGLPKMIVGPLLPYDKTTAIIPYNYNNYDIIKNVDYNYIKIINYSNNSSLQYLQSSKFKDSIFTCSIDPFVSLFKMRTKFFLTVFKPSCQT